MHCIYPHCEGTMSVAGSTGYCERCRLPVGRCEACGAWNRSAAALCRMCGRRTAGGVELAGAELGAWVSMLEREPVRLRLEEPIRTLPQVGAGFVWAMGEQGNLYRVNPYERDGRTPDVCTRMWAKATPHAFAMRDLERSPGAELSEIHAVAATAERVSAWGVVSQSTRVFEGLERGEEILADARDRYQLIDADRSSVFCLARGGGEVSILQIDLPRREVRRHRLGVQAGLGQAVCGPVVVAGRVLAWSAHELFTVIEGGVERMGVPPGVQVWTEPAESSAMRLPLGRPPCMVAGESVYLPCDHYGGPGLLRVQAAGAGWSVSAIPVPGEGGTMAQDADGSPLLASRGRLLRCVGNSFREVAADEQMSSRFAAFNAGEVSVFFCEGEYGVRSHDWLQARGVGGSRRVNWSVEGGQLLKECGGFWTVSGALVAQLLVEEGRMRTEFVSWHL